MRNRKHFIYKITNKTNGKCYIGYTAQRPETRWRRHEMNAKKGCKGRFYDAIRKYGWENFTKEILYSSEDGQNTKNIMESHFIKKFNSFEHGYNMTLGGDGCLGVEFSEKYKVQRSNEYKGSNNPFYGKHHSEDSKKLISEAVLKTRHFRVGELAPNYGKVRSEEAKRITAEKLSATWRIIRPNGLIETVHNLTDFCKANHLTKPLMISVSKGRQSHHKGYKCQKLETAF